MKAFLRYGKGEHELLLPDDWNVTVLGKKQMPILADPKDVVEKAFEKSFEQNLQDKKSVCILICDITRPMPNGQVLPPLIRKLIEKGISQKDITILVATGLHRPNEGRELEEILGDAWLYQEIRAVNHFAGNRQDHVDLGLTKRGTPILLDRRFAEADLRIVVGLVEPHFMAGYSGGRKLISPGIAHESTIRKFHSAKMLDDPSATNCMLVGNPLHDELIEISRKVSPVLALNAVLSDEREIAFVNFGELEKCHLEAAKFAAVYSEISVPGPFRTVIASAAGYPLDSTYYQTVKGMVSASQILAPGGALFIASACTDGLGSEAYRKAQQLLVRVGADGFLDEIRKRDRAEVDEWQTQMQIRAMKRGDIHLFTDGLGKQDKALTGVSCVDSLEQSVKKWVNEIGDPNVIVIPEGPYLVPKCSLSS